MINRILTILLILIGSVQAGIKITGVRHFSNKSIKEFLRSSPSLDSSRIRIDQDYLALGYFKAFSTIESNEIDTTLTVEEGKQYKIADVRFIGVEDSLAQRGLEKFRTNAPLDSNTVHALILNICRSYANIGYPFCAVAIKSIEVGADSLTFNCHVNKGPKTVVGAINFTGLTVTQPSILYRHLAIHKNDEYDEESLEKSVRSLRRLTYSRLAANPYVLYDNRLSATDIVFPMHDEKSVSIDGMAFLNPDNTLAGRASLGLKNVFGHGEELQFLYSKVTQSSKRLLLSVSVPYVTGAPLSLETSLSQEDRDSSFVATTANVGLAYSFAGRWSLGSSFEWSKITPEEEGRQTNSARLLSAALNLRFDSRDDIRRTTSGFYLSQRLKSSYRRSFDPSGDISSGYSTHLDAALRLWKPLKRDIVFYQKVAAFQISSDFNPIPVDQLIPVGGLETLRGYRENSYLAKSGILATSELRWYALDNLLLHVFCDNGFIATLQSDHRLTGFGTGMVIETGAGSFNFDLSLGEEKSFGSLLVHFGFSGAF